MTAYEAFGPHVLSQTCGDPPNRACIAGCDAKWEGYLLGIEETLRAIDSFSGVQALAQALIDEYYMESAFQ